MAVVNYLLLADQTFHHVSDWSRTLLTFHERQQLQFALSFDAWKASTIASFEAREDSDGAVTGLRRMSLLMQKCPEAGLALMTGSDYLESIIEAYQRMGSLSENDMQTKQQILTENLHRCLRSLMCDQTKHPSLLLDHLYLLKSE
ncbi:MAG: hypothetical protein M1823_008408, partial [Watsoniomyces obsoletus]